jgi:hypothetical protein
MQSKSRTIDIIYDLLPKKRETAPIRVPIVIKPLPLLLKSTLRVSAAGVNQKAIPIMIAKAKIIISFGFGMFPERLLNFGVRVRINMTKG